MPLPRAGGPGPPPATPPAGPGRLADFLVDPLVRHQPIGIDRVRRRRPHGTARLVQVATIVEPALIEVRPKLRKAVAEGAGLDSPRADFAQAGWVPDVADPGDRHELSGGRRMLARAPFLARSEER